MELNPATAASDAASPGDGRIAPPATRASGVRPEEWLAATYAAAIALLFFAFALPLSVVAMGREYAKFLLAILAVSLPIWLGARVIDLAKRRLDYRAAGADLVEIGRSLVPFWIVLIAYTHLKSRVAAFNPRLLDELLRDLDSVLHPVAAIFSPGCFRSPAIRSGARSGAWSTSIAAAALALPYGVAFARAVAPPCAGSTPRWRSSTSRDRLSTSPFRRWAPASPFDLRSSICRASLAWSVQELMLKSYLYVTTHADAPALPFAGIAAFPSLHLATTGVGLFVAGRWCRPLLLLLVPWNLAIAWSALYFGWHYAVDFYPGLLLAWGGWWLAGRWTERPAGRTEAS